MSKSRNVQMSQRRKNSAVISSFGQPKCCPCCLQTHVTPKPQSQIPNRFAFRITAFSGLSARDFAAAQPQTHLPPQPQP